MKVEVIKPARLNGENIEVGEVVELDSQLAKNWVRLGFAKPAGNSNISGSKDNHLNLEDPQGNEEWPKHLGGGWYMLPNDEKVQGKEEAMEAMKALEGEGVKSKEPENEQIIDNIGDENSKAGDIDGTETDNSTS